MNNLLDGTEVFGAEGDGPKLTARNVELEDGHGVEWNSGLVNEHPSATKGERFGGQD